MHDWTRVEAGIFHDFHVSWIPEIRKVLNGGLLPEGYYALAEQHAGRSLAIRHVSGHRLVALVEIVSPGNKDRVQHVQEFTDKILSALNVGVHVLLVDLFPPGPQDPDGLHGILLRQLEGSDERYELPRDEPSTLASYAAGLPVEIDLDHVGVGAELPEMPLFLRPDRYVNVPLEPTDEAAYRGLPAFWRQILEGSDPPPI